MSMASAFLSLVFAQQAPPAGAAPPPAAAPTAAPATGGATGLAPVAPPDPMMQLIGSLLPLVLMIVVFWFLIIRPSAKRAKQHQEMLTNLKRGDVVFTSGGLIGKIKSLSDDEVRLELNQNVEVRVLRRDIGGVRTKAEPAPANDSKA